MHACQMSSTVISTILFLERSECEKLKHIQGEYFPIFILESLSLSNVIQILFLKFLVYIKYPALRPELLNKSAQYLSGVKGYQLIYLSVIPQKLSVNFSLPMMGKIAKVLLILQTISDYFCHDADFSDACTLSKSMTLWGP